MDLSEYRASPLEQMRTADLLRLMPTTGCEALDIGARDGHFSLLMADRFAQVTALDLVQPNISHRKVQCVAGNAAQMTFPDNAFDFVFCAEVLEHIPTSDLKQVCQEIERVTRKTILVGVPYLQDTRVGRTTCYSCSKRNPPWGHVNWFDEQRIAALFQAFDAEVVSFVGITTARTNWLSSILMDFAGNPYGTYDQAEPCIHCGHTLVPPPDRNLAQRLATRCAVWARGITEVRAKPRGNWMHVLLRKKHQDTAKAGGCGATPKR